MKHLKTHLQVTTRLLAIASVISAIAAGPALAQKAALVKNTDEPGRVPYEANAVFTTATCESGCSNFLSNGTSVLFDLPAVPAGKRLIIKSVSGLLPSSGPGHVIAFQTAHTLSLQFKWIFWGPFYDDFGAVGFSVQNTFITYGPGESPHVAVSLPNPVNGVDASVAVEGYLIDATN